MFSKENLQPASSCRVFSIPDLIGFLSLCPQKWWPNLQNHAGAPVDAIGEYGWFYSRPSLQQFRKDTIFRYIQIFNGLNCWCVWSICVKQRSDHHLKLRVKTSTATVLLSLNSIVTQSYSSAYPSSWYLDILISWYLEILWFWYHFGLILVSFRTCWYLSHPSWIRFLRSVSWAPRACWAPWAPRWPWSGRFHVAAGDAATRPQHVRNP